MADKKKKLISTKTLVKTRALLSTTLLVDVIILVFTGIKLLFSPSRKEGIEASWRLLGVKLTTLELIHVVAGFLMAGLVIIHFALNYTMYKNEMKMLFSSKK